MSLWSTHTHTHTQAYSTRCNISARWFISTASKSHIRSISLGLPSINENRIALKVLNLLNISNALNVHAFFHVLSTLNITKSKNNEPLLYQTLQNYLHRMPTTTTQWIVDVNNKSEQKNNLQQNENITKKLDRKKNCDEWAWSYKMNALCKRHQRHLNNLSLRPDRMTDFLKLMGEN